MINDTSTHPPLLVHQQFRDQSRSFMSSSTRERDRRLSRSFNGHSPLSDSPFAPVIENIYQKHLSPEVPASPKLDYELNSPRINPPQKTDSKEDHENISPCTPAVINAQNGASFIPFEIASDSTEENVISSRTSVVAQATASDSETSILTRSGGLEKLLKYSPKDACIGCQFTYSLKKLVESGSLLCVKKNLSSMGSVCSR